MDSLQEDKTAVAGRGSRASMTSSGTASRHTPHGKNSTLIYN
jgi:hypothetical protein